MNERSRWRGRNVPIPGPHIAGLAASLLLHSIWPRPLGHRAAGRAVGTTLLTAGTALAAWATASAGPTDLAQPDRLVTAGAYARSRHPMYVAWTLVYVGAAALANTAWPLILLPGVAAAMHREVRREEERLATRFDPVHEAYVDRVRRYV